MARHLTWNTMVDSLRHHDFGKNRDTVTTAFKVIIEQLKDYSVNRIGIREADLIQKVQGAFQPAPYELIYMILATLCSNEFVVVKRLQVGTAGTTDIFYTLAQDVEVTAIPALEKKST